jgi:uncharacterized tellurite resistance protein B-like protein
MLDALKRLFENRPAADEAPAEREHGLRLATAALLFEVVRADGEVHDDERRLLRTAVQSTFELPAAELDALLAEAEASADRAVSLYEFTRVLDTSWPPEQKKRVVELLWLVAFADARKDPLEEHLVRKIAGLLHVPHPDFIDAKQRARAAQPES